jgi:hypothetical protein
VLRLGIVLIAIVVAAWAIACGGSGSSEDDSDANDETAAATAAWATAIKLALDDLRASHLGDASQSELNADGEFVVGLCAAALADLTAESLGRSSLSEGCEVALRAGSTPAISAPPIYEDAYAKVDEAGAMLGWQSVSAAERSHVRRRLVELNDPSTASNEDEYERMTTTLSVMCESYLFEDLDDPEAICLPLIRYLEAVNYENLGERLDRLWTDFIADIGGGAEGTD